MNPTIKIVIVGNTGVGKTSMVNWYIYNQHIPYVDPTVGAAFHIKHLYCDNSPTGKVSVQIWDTAGQERYRSIIKMYYRNANACICVLDVTDKQSYIDLNYWIKSYYETVDNSNIIIVANKIDKNVWMVKEEDIKSIADKYKCDYYLTTMSDPKTIENIFEKITDMCKKNINQVENKPINFIFDLAPKESAGSYCTC